MYLHFKTANSLKLKENINDQRQWLMHYELLLCNVLGRHGYGSFFIRFNSVSESFHRTQLMTHNGFTRIDSNLVTTQNGFLKFDSNRLMTQKDSRIF